jgi:RHS repeat-associated protein
MQEITYPHPTGWPAGATVATYNYAHGLLGSVTTNRTGISAGFAYHPSGLLKVISHGNGTKTLIGSDTRGRLATIKVTDPVGAALWQTGTHRYDGGGNIYEIGESTFADMDYWKFRYDERQRLVWAKLAKYTISYAYDSYGNMTTQNFDFGSPPVGMAFANRSYTDTLGHNNNQIQDTGYSYDGNGNLRDGAGTAYDYNARNQLTATGPVVSGCQMPCEMDPLLVRGVYQYSAAGLRVSREDRVSGWTTFYFRDLSGEVLSEYARPNAGGEPAWSRDYVQGAGRQLAIVENGPPAASGDFLTCAQASTRDCGVAVTTPYSVKLDWANNTESDMNGYRVYRSCDRTRFDPASTKKPKLMTATDLSTSYYVDSGYKNCDTVLTATCTAGSSYYCWYAVTAVDRSGKEGPYSTPLAFQLNDTTPPSKPLQPRVDGTTGTTVSLSWSPPQGTLPVDFLGYNVWRSVASGDPQPVRVNAVPLTGTALTDVGLNCGWTYYYRVTAVDTASNQSVYSAEVSTATATCGGGGGDGKKHTELLPGEDVLQAGEVGPVVGVAEVREGSQPEPPLQDCPPGVDEGESDERPRPMELVGFLMVSYQSLGPSATDWVGYTLHTDHLGSVRRVTGASGQIVAKHDYLPFGKEIPPLQKSPSAHRYTGHEWDSESDLAYMLARYCSAGLGRFISADPAADSQIESPQSWNKYSYVANNPLVYVDPTGEFKARVHYDLTLEAFGNPRLADAVKAVDRGFSHALFNPRGHFGGRAAGDLLLGEAIDAAKLGDPTAADWLLAQAIHVVQDDVAHRDTDGRRIGWWEHGFRVLKDAFINGCQFSPDCKSRGDFETKKQEARQRTVEIRGMWEEAMASGDWSEWNRKVKINIRIDGPKIIIPVGNGQTPNPMSPMQLRVDNVCIRGCGMGK